ncbi:MAG: helix-hairpin-helix domain-containing protein [Nitrospirae bacterium]|nr:helix-hairpin-helix domain-containing protein [Nitrospirota bacterium]
MRKFVVLGAALVAAVAANGCVVGQSKYDAAVAETETAKTELEKTRAQKNALELQVKSLKDLNAKMTADTELALAELQRIKDSRDKERSSIEGRIKEQEQKIKELTAQLRTVRREYEAAKRQNEKLNNIVARHQKELKERQLGTESVSPPAPSRLPASPSPGPAQATAPGMLPSAPATPTPTSPSHAPGTVNVNTASASDLVLFLGLTKEVADKVVANRPYKVRGELVSKNVLPKGTFDAIKDRISVAP